MVVVETSRFNRLRRGWRLVRKAASVHRVASSTLEIYNLRPGPDGLTRILVRSEAGGIERSWLVPSSNAADTVLAEWAEFHDAVLGYPPSW